MKSPLLAAFALALLLATTVAAAAETCFYSSEKVDGQNKICTYSCTSGKYAMTIKSVQLCPLSVKR